MFDLGWGLGENPPLPPALILDLHAHTMWRQSRDLTVPAVDFFEGWRHVWGGG